MNRFLFVCLALVARNAFAQCPPVVTVTPLSQTSVDVSVAPFTSGLYTLNWTCGNASGSIEGLTAATTSVSKLTPGCDFTAVVTSPMLCGGLPNSDTVQLTLTCAPPQLEAVSTSPTSATYTWTGVAGATGYRLYYKPATTGAWNSVLTGNVTSFTVTGLTPNTVYLAFVRGLNCPVAGTPTLRSNLVAVYPSVLPLCTPTPVITATSNVCSQITVTFVSGTSPQVRVWLRRLFPPFSADSFNVSSGAPVNFNIGSQATGRYLVYAQSICPGTTPQFSHVSNSVTMTAGCRAPHTVNVTDIDCNGFTVNWESNICLNPGFSGYRLLARPQDTAAWTTYYMGTDTVHTISPLLPNVTYEVALRTMSCSGLSPLSVVQTVFTDGPGCRFAVDGDVSFAGERTQLRVYPNPASGTVNVDIARADDKPLTYAVYNVIGQPVQTGELNEASTIVVADLPNGCYHLQMSSNGATIGNAHFIVAR
ncbi:MAG TPA: fibronectin type III domain-containing protein [Chitinophagales bacterium]|nr:fibronectin type III domain-containing protein [Chitinophagales bacterium]